MRAFEDRVRDSLHELADTVPASAHPRADLERRLARRRAGRRRRPALVVAAAAVVIAGVALPVALNRGGEDQPAATAPHVATTTPPSEAPQDPKMGIELGSFTEDGVDRTAVFTLPSDTRWCVARTFPPGAEPLMPTCETVPSWAPVPEGPGHVQSRPVLGDGQLEGGPLPHLMLFVTAPTITELVVRAGDGTPVDVRTIAGNAAANYYLADFGGSTQGFGYDALDAQGNVVESAIT